MKHEQLPVSELILVLIGIKQIHFCLQNCQSNVRLTVISDNWRVYNVARLLCFFKYIV